MSLIIKERRETKRRRREWVRNWRLRRQENGAVYLMYSQLHLRDVNEYRRYLHMHEDVYGSLKNALRTNWQKNRHLEYYTALEEALAVSLNFLATGKVFPGLVLQSKTARAHFWKTVLLICKLIVVTLRPIHLQFPRSLDECKAKARDLNELLHFPLCVGVLNTKHIPFRASNYDGAVYRNMKGFNSIILLAICDANFKFTYIDVGGNGRLHNDDALTKTSLHNLFEYPEVYLPDDEVIGKKRRLPYNIIADDTFALRNNLLVPYSNAHLTINQKIFNFRLNHARQIIDETFYMLQNTFPVLKTTINLQAEKVATIVEACCVLHNYLIAENEADIPILQRRRYDFENNLNMIQSELTGDIRNEFAEYFAAEGSVPWQNSYV